MNLLQQHQHLHRHRHLPNYLGYVLHHHHYFLEEELQEECFLFLQLRILHLDHLHHLNRQHHLVLPLWLDQVKVVVLTHHRSRHMRFNHTMFCFYHYNHFII